MTNAELPRPRVTARHLWAWAVGTVFVVVHTLLWLPYTRGDDFSAIVGGARVLHDGHRDQLYAADPANFVSLASSHAWDDALAALGADGVYAHPYVYNPIVAVLTAPLTEKFDFDWLLTCNTVLASAAMVVLLWGSAHLTRTVTGNDPRGAYRAARVPFAPGPFVAAARGASVLVHARDRSPAPWPRRAAAPRPGPCVSTGSLPWGRESIWGIRRRRSRRRLSPGAGAVPGSAPPSSRPSRGCAGSPRA